VGDVALGGDGDYHRDVQTWLGQLPRDVAEAIAWKNGERLFPTP
jgi:hypothetical protein